MGKPNWAAAMMGRASSQAEEGSPQEGCVHGAGLASAREKKRLKIKE